MEIFIVQVVIPVCTILVSVLIGVYTVQGRIKNENKESHKPYLVLRDLEKIDNPDLYDFYLHLYGQKYIEEKESSNLYLRWTIGNIGYGVASNIKFFDLSTTQPFEKVQIRNIEKDQKLYTTFDIADNRDKHIDMICTYSKGKKNDLETDKTYILCVYQDLNQNYYDFIICITYKGDSHYDYSIFQRTSRSYKNICSEYKSNFKTIINNYKKQ